MLVWMATHYRIDRLFPFGFHSGFRSFFAGCGRTLNDSGTSRDESGVDAATPFWGLSLGLLCRLAVHHLGACRSPLQ
eukprot:4662545-Amphidinium_carterae.3